MLVPVKIGTLFLKFYIYPKLKNLSHLFIVHSIAFAKKLALFILLSLSAIFSNAQVHADFIATPDAGCAPLLVNFNDLSTGNPASWKWDLGNGTTSFLQNPSVTYFNPGQYSIKLVVKNSQGADSIVKNQLIKVYASPVVNFSGTPQTGCFPLPAQFTDLSVPGSGTNTGWEWDFGDGILSANQNPQHTYNAAGNYNVSLRITNSFGCVASVTYPQYIQISSGVKAAFTNTVPATCNQPDTIQFSNNSTGIGTLSFQWKFGDGSTSALADPIHIYSVPGSYTVSLVVFNSNGCSDTIIKPNLITVSNFKANFSTPSVVCQGSDVNFLNTSSPVPSSVIWYFGDGTFSDSTNLVKNFTNTGNFNVKMIAAFGSCKDSVENPIQVVAKPIVDFSASPTFSCKAPLTVNFSNITSGRNTFSWDFGDGTSSNLANPSHTYLKEGFYSVTLVVTNAPGCKNSIIKNDFIQIKSPVVSINNLPQKGCGPLTHTFTANVNSIDPVTGYVWDFGDGTTSALSSPTHTYTMPGAYTVSLYYSTSAGCTDTVKVVNGILVGAKPGVNFSALPRDACANTKINFTDLSTGNPDEWLWAFGDGSGSIVKNPDHQYTDTGYFSITLIAISNGCADTLSLPNYIHIKPPVARFKYTNTCSLPGHVVFTDMSIGADSWSWNFGDGASSTIQNPVHDYSVSGVYTVQLTVTNNTTGCNYTKEDTVTVLKEISDFTSSVTAVCKNAPVVFSAVNSNPGNISLYTWRFGDGIAVSGTSGSISHNYTGSGNYNVTMIIDLINGCTDSIVKPLAIKVDGPTAVFRTVNPGACQNNAVTFIDSSYANGTRTIQQRQWNWGDGVIQILNGPVFQHTYNTPGNYSVLLKVTDNNGCTDSIMHVNAVVISKPVASFSSDTLSCSSSAITFANASTGPGLSYLWNFGDSSTSTQLNPVHTFSNEGTYNVSLAITDLYGCTDFISKNNYVRIANPKANFSVSDTAGNCPPLIVNFTNASTNYFSWAWDFGDGSTSNSFNPSHFYAMPGTFNAVLTIKGPGGCTDQKSVQIKIKGPTGTFSYSNISGCKPLQTNFKASTAKNTTFVWDFNDGVTIVTPNSTVSHTFKTAGGYLPKMILVDANGCKVPIIGIDSIKVFEVHALFTNSVTSLCDSGRVAFTNMSTGNDIITNHLWDFGDKTISFLPNPVHNYIATGNYAARLLITSKSGCTDSVTVPSAVKIVNSPKISIGGNSGACTPALLNFTGLILVSDTSSLKWKWDFANGNVSTLQNPPSQIFVKSGSYSVNAIATNSSGCSDTAIKVAQAYSLPDLHPTADTTLCKGASLILKANNAQIYSWSPATFLSCTSCVSTVTRPDSAIKYFVTGKNIKGCFSTDSVFVDVKVPNTVKVSGPDTLCFGSSVQLFARGAETYTWSPSTGLNNTGIASPVAAPAATTTYKVTASDTKGCFTSTAYIPVTVYPIPIVTAGADKTINVGQSFDIIPHISSDVTSFIWSPSAGIIARNDPGITVKPVQSTEYTIEVKNAGGCRARDRISIYVLCDNSNVFVPNTFSPNGDGVNDIFYPRGSGVFSIKNLRIFNRWGEVVFEKANFNANDASAGWDGTFKGKKLSPDVFVYTLEVVCANNQPLVFKGNVALIR
jgi:gliding motility-associated-like protein